jgi:hypothetical protein
VLLRPIETSDSTADFILRAITGLHNFLLEFATVAQHPARLADSGLSNENNGRWRQDVPKNLELQSYRMRGGPNKSSTTAKATRQNLLEYFNTSGKVVWQDDYL